MIHWGFFDVNNNIVALQINDGIITICAMDTADSPTTKKVITQQTYRLIMQGISVQASVLTFFGSFSGPRPVGCARHKAADWCLVSCLSPPLPGRAGPFWPGAAGEGWGQPGGLRPAETTKLFRNQLVFPPAEFG